MNIMTGHTGNYYATGNETRHPSSPPVRKPRVLTPEQSYRRFPMLGWYQFKNDEKTRRLVETDSKFIIGSREDGEKLYVRFDIHADSKCALKWALNNGLFVGEFGTFQHLHRVDNF